MFGKSYGKYEVERKDDKSPDYGVSLIRRQSAPVLKDDEIKSAPKIQLEFKKDKNKADSFSKTANAQTHYKLTTKSESYSKGGFGNGFLSKAERFSGLNPLKYMHVPRAAPYTDLSRKSASPKQAAIRVKKLTRPGEAQSRSPPVFLMQA